MADNTQVTRRAFSVSVAATATGMLSGCLSSSPYYGLQLKNFTETDYEVRVRVQNTNREELVLDSVFELSGRDRTVVEEVFDKEEEYLVDAVVGDHTAEHYFDPGDDGNAPVASLHVDIYDGGRTRIFLPAP